MENTEKDMENFETEEQLKKDNKKLIKIIIVAIAITVAIAIAIVIAIKVIQNNIKNEKILEITSISDKFENQELDYNSAIEFFTQFDGEDDQDIQNAIKNEKSDLESLKLPTQKYYSGLELKESGKYLKAADEFKQVSEISC